MHKIIKPIDRWLGLCATALGIVMYWIPKTPGFLIGSLVLIFILLIHPIWNFWWIEKKLRRRGCALLFVSLCLCVLGYFLWPVQQLSFPVKFKTVQPAQYLLDNQGGVYVVIPDVQITNLNNVTTVANVELLVKSENGGLDWFDPLASRIQEVELWLDRNHLANSNFIGRQINIPPNSGVNGYMCFYADKFHLEMSGQTIDRFRHSEYLFHVEQAGLEPRDISHGEAIIGHEVNKIK